MRISFPLLDEERDFEEGLLVSDACNAMGVPLDLVCGGNGTCGKCTVNVVEDGRQHRVLGCQHHLSDGMKILVSKGASDHKILETFAKETRAFAPGIHVIRIDYADLDTPMGGYDFSSLSQVVRQKSGIELDVLSYEMLIKLSECYRLKGVSYLNVVVKGNQLIDLVPSNGSMDLYGIAVDIGTTTVVLFLYDLQTGKLIGHSSAINGQHAFGADVISRIEHASASAETLSAEQKAIEGTINELIDSVCAQYRILADCIYEAVYCGNSTMQHLFLGISPAALGRIPFAGAISQAAHAPANAMNIHINPHGTHVFMPLLGGYVGADTTACLLELPDDGKVRMMIDLGTNCEISLGTGSGFMVTSTACGPALEGAGTSMGMRAMPGAIEHVRFDEGACEFVVQTIGDTAPVGFCGSGILDTVAVLLRTGILTPTGTFIKGAELEHSPFKDRIRSSKEQGRYFVLIDSMDNPNGTEISLSLKDVRAIQLAKAAIRTGWTLITQTYGIALKDIYEIHLAGAFGNYIDIPNAQYMGLLPQVDGVPISSMGNGAGLGVQRYLLSQEERERAEDLRAHAKHVELADNSRFSKTYMSSMAFLQ